MNALRAFDAAARHMSFTLAADELCVSQAAVSYQIRQLELDVGVKLFHRRHRKLVLTDAGNDYLPDVRRALGILAESAARLMQPKYDGTLKISASQSLSSRWLAHRINDISSTFPDFNISIDAADDLRDFARDDTDLAIRYAQTVDPELESVLLASDQIFPVCSPDLLNEPKSSPSDLDFRNYTLLHDEMTDIGWEEWLSAAGIKLKDPSPAVQFSHSGLTIDAAIAGQGMALGRSLLVADDLKAGRLVRPCDLSLTSDYAYYIVYPRRDGEIKKIRPIMDWLLAEAGGSGNVISA